MEARLENRNCPSSRKAQDAVSFCRRGSLVISGGHKKHAEPCCSGQPFWESLLGLFSFRGLQRTYRGRNLVPKLAVEMIPSTSWWNNARSRIPRDEWDFLRKQTYQAANFNCEICGASGMGKKSLEAHEIWEYNLETKIQALIRLIALCYKCHRVVHFGKTQLLGRAAEAAAIRHLQKVNFWTEGEALSHIRQAIVEWKFRSQIQWTLDIEVLKNV